MLFLSFVGMIIESGMIFHTMFLILLFVEMHDDVLYIAIPSTFDIYYNLDTVKHI